MASSTSVATITKTRQKTKPPGLWKVIIYNDDHTPVDFVVALLMKIFHHPEDIAKTLTERVHNTGSAIAGVYPHEIAEQKSEISMKISRDFGFPLRLTIEEE